MGISRSRPYLIDRNITTSSRSGLLIHVVQRADWEEARALLRRSDARRLVEHIDDFNKNALHWACQRRAPLDVIQAMLNASEKAPLKHYSGYTPLHCAIFYTPLHQAIIQSSEEIIIMLIEACPRAASIATNDGWTPLHTAIHYNRSSEVICRLLAANPTAATTVSRNGTTPLRMLFRRWNVPLRNTLESINGNDKATQAVVLQCEGCQIEIGELHKVVLQAATHGSIEDNQEPPFQPLHTAINDYRCPWSFVNLMMRMDTMLASEWDREGQLPIHVAAAATTSFGDDKIPAVIRDLLGTNSEFAKIPDQEGRLPLHIAIENETQFGGGLETILRAAPKALNTRDIKTHMYPFLLAAAKHGSFAIKLQKFTSCFTLLMDNPHLVWYGIPH